MRSDVLDSPRGRSEAKLMRVYLAGPPFADEYRRRAEALLRAAGHEQRIHER
ncbi:MAG TPA: hypothetical protein VGU71_06540 [Candidatus Dormibacteraeota bacterium]|nr:hypothetical protein [Candidatus Dormibacteraeota bacterium]